MMRLFLIGLLVLAACSRTEIAAPAAAPSPTGQEVPNGGEYVKSTFILKGREVIRFLRETDDGRALVQRYRLDVDRLERTLRDDNIRVVDAVLFDNSGSIVDARGKLDEVVLDRQRWYDHFDKKRDIHYLVFHEMMRSATIADPDYDISLRIVGYKLETPTLALAESDFRFLRLNVAGSGCAANGLTVASQFKSNQLLLGLSAYLLPSMQAMPRFPFRTACSLRIPYEVPPGKRLVAYLTQGEGAAVLKRQAIATLSLISFFSNRPGESIQRYTIAPQTAVPDFTFKVGGAIGSGCSPHGIFGMNTSIYVENAHTDDFLVSLKKLVVNFRLEDCEP